MESKDRWIPITEDLPKKDGYYLVTDASGGTKETRESFFCRCDDGECYWDFIGVIAWRPLPDPYEEKETAAMMEG